MTGENISKIGTIEKKADIRYVFAAAMFLVLIFIWPFSLLKIIDPNANNRLLKQEGDYSYFYVSGDEYLTTVVKGNGAFVDSAAIRLRFQDKVPEDAILHVYMFDSEGNIVVDSYVNIFPRPENDIYDIPFDLEMAKDREYQFIMAPESDYTIGVFCYQQTSEPAVMLHNTDPSLSRALDMVSSLLTICIWICGLLFILSLLAGDKLSAIGISTSNPYIFVPSLISVMGLIIYGQYLVDYNLESKEGLYKGMVLIVILTLMAFLCTFFGKNDIWIAGFVLFSLGCIYLLTFPEGMVPDEKTHFYRAFSLAFGNLQAVKLSDLSVGGILPSAIRDFADKDAVLDFADTIPLDFKNTSLYSPICYLPQIIGIRVALLFTSHIHIVFMTARWCGFIGAFVLSMLALYYVPVCKEFMLVVMLLPMTMQEMTGVTSDAMTNGLSFLFVAVVLKCIADDVVLSTRKIVIITILGTCIGMCKMVYIPLWLILFLIPRRLFGIEDNSNDTEPSANEGIKEINNKFNFKYAVVFVIPIIMCALTNGILGKNLVPVGENVDAAEQIKYVLTHIPDTFMIVIRTLINSSAQWSHEMTGDFLGGLNIRTLPLITIVLLFMLYISARDAKLYGVFASYKAKLIFGLTFGLGIVMILGTLYVTWTTIGYYIIRGIQGRYYIAMLPALGLFIASMYADPKAGDDIERNIDLETTRNNSFKLPVLAYNKLGVIIKLYILLLINMFTIVDIYKYLIVN